MRREGEYSEGERHSMLGGVKKICVSLYITKTNSQPVG